MRAYDWPVPVPVDSDRPGPDVPMGQWPAQLFVGIESIAFDDPQWDAATPLEWDVTTATWDEFGGEESEYTDAICWLLGLEIEHDTPDAELRFTASSCTFELDNRDGRWSRYSPTGRLSFYPPGRRVQVWAELDGEPWWLFSGRIASWVELPGGRIEVRAFDAFSDFNLRRNAWTAGAGDGTDVPTRLWEILNANGFDGTALLYADAGTVRVLQHETSASPLEEMQATAESDGGVLFVDSDGRLIYRNRHWTEGRDDQGAVPVVSGNVCDAPIVVWDLELTTDDAYLVNEVTLTNIDEPPITVDATNVLSRQRFGRYTSPQNRDDDLWQFEEEGQDLADYLVAQRGEPTSRISNATLWLHDPRFDYWRAAVDLRRGDLVEFVQDVLTQDSAPHRIDTFHVVIGIRHQVTPSEWVTSFSTSRVVASKVVTRWDESPFTWDDPDETNVWSN